MGFFGKDKDENVAKPSLIRRILSSLGEILFVFAALLLVAGAISSAGYWGFVGACILVLPAIAFCRTPFRIMGAIVLVLGILGIMDTKDAPSVQTTYMRRAKTQRAADFAQKVCDASMEFKTKQGVWPKSLDDLKLTLTDSSGYVQSVAIDKDGTIRVILSFTPVEGKALVCTPVVSGVSGWKFSAPDILHVYLPSRFKE